MCGQKRGYGGRIRRNRQLRLTTQLLRRRQVRNFLRILFPLAAALVLIFHPQVNLAAQESTRDLTSKCFELFQFQMRYNEAERYCKQALKLAEKRGDLVQLSSAVTTLGSIYMAQGRYPEAESQYRRGLTIMERRFGSGHPMAMGGLISLGQVLELQGRLAEAADLFERALEQDQSRSAGAGSMSLVLSLALGRVYLSEGRYSEAVSMLRRALEATHRGVGFGKALIAGLHNFLGRAYLGMERLPEAERALKLSLRYLGQNAGIPASTVRAMALSALAVVYQRQKRFSEAEPMFRTAANIVERIGVSENPTVSQLYVNAAGFFSELGRYGEALTYARRATAIHRSRKASIQGQSQHKIQRELAATRQAVEQHLGAIVRVAEKAPNQILPLAFEAFDIIQLAHETSAAAAIAQMAARFSTANDELAGVVRERQDAIRRSRGLDDMLTKMVTRPQVGRNPAAEERARNTLVSLKNKIRDLDRRLAQDFPKFAEFMKPEPMALTDAQSLLAEDEAMLAYFVGDEESYVWVLRANNSALERLDIGTKDLVNSVAQIRTSLDPIGVTRLIDIPRFDFETAFSLYRRVFAPTEPYLKGVKHIIQVPDGALQSLPLGVLLTAAPPVRLDDFKRYSEVNWLAKKFAVTVLPSITSLRALRRFARKTKSSVPFIGFGDPLLNGHPDTKRSISLTSLFDSRGIANVQAVRQLPALPETAKELLQIAQSLGVGQRSLFLRERATESQVRTLDLTDYRIIAFATHGLIAGDLAGLAEPALVLTPPAKGSEGDDGLLTASEITRLKLDADWVVLSACNTAAPDGTPGAQGLSGLARAFFYAGARALLVSHWPVVSDAAVELTTRTFAVFSKDKSIGRSEALRRSMLVLMSNQEKPHYAHPIFWAPFAVVGEGGVRRAQ